MRLRTSVLPEVSEAVRPSRSLLSSHWTLPILKPRTLNGEQRSRRSRRSRRRLPITRNRNQRPHHRLSQRLRQPNRMNRLNHRNPPVWSSSPAPLWRTTGRVPRHLIRPALGCFRGHVAGGQQADRPVHRWPPALRWQIEPAHFAAGDQRAVIFTTAHSTVVGHTCGAAGNVGFERTSSGPSAGQPALQDHNNLDKLFRQEWIRDVRHRQNRRQAIQGRRW